MIHFTVWLAQDLDPNDVLKAQMRLNDSRAVQVFIWIGAFVLVVIAGGYWAFRYSRRSRRRKHRLHRSESLREAGAATMGDAVKNSKNKRRRRTDRPRRKMNPTLAETGGLPPVRDETIPPNFP